VQTHATVAMPVRAEQEEVGRIVPIARWVSPGSFMAHMRNLEPEVQALAAAPWEPTDPIPAPDLGFGVPLVLLAAPPTILLSSLALSV